MIALRAKFNRALEFMRTDLWDIDIRRLSLPRRIGLRGLRVVRMVVEGFGEDKLSLHASALTFASLVSLVPVLAISFAVLKGMSFEKKGESYILGKMSQMPPDFQNAVIENFINPVTNMNFTAIGSVGVLVLFYAVVKMLGSIEFSFNSIWGVTEPRRFLRKCTDYISTVVIVPILVIAGITMRTSGKMAIQWAPAVQLYETLKLSGLLTSWLGFTFLFMFMPNTKVKFLPASLSGLITMFMVSTWQYIYVTFQVGITRNNAIFGTFAAIPIFLAWLYVTWILVLLGAEICFAMQSSTSFAMEQKSDDASPLARVKVALAVTIDAAQSLLQGRQPFNIETYTMSHRVPVRLLNSVTHVLCEEGYLAEMKNEDGSFVLARDPAVVKARDIALAVLDHGSDAHDLGLGELDLVVDVALESLDADGDGAEGGRTIKDLLGALES